LRHFDYNASLGLAFNCGSIPVPKVDEVRDSVGAGDSFVAGYISELVNGKSRMPCIKKGVNFYRRIKKGPKRQKYRDLAE
jgi:hypothetical protein